MSTQYIPTQPAAAEEPASPRKDRGSGLTAIMAVLVDSWNELRVNRLRILLALIGITVAVIGLTGALGGGAILREMMVQSGERSSGRTATIELRGDFAKNAALEERATRIPNDFGITHSTRVFDSTARVWTPQYQFDASVRLVDPDYEIVYRVPVEHGRFLVPEDRERLSPALVVNEAFWERLGSPNLSQGATATFIADGREQTATIVGVVTKSGDWEQPAALALADSSVAPLTSSAPNNASIAMWVPEGISDELAMQLNEQLKPLGMSAMRVDWAKQSAEQIVWLQIGVIAAAAGMFLLGAIGLININLVTMQHRVREIGIRRSYGATTGRIFFTVLLESVVATFVAGFIGVVITAIAATNPWTESFLRSMGVYEPVAFPLDAALIGLLAATVVGAIAGALPAWKATRVQIVDAIRY